MNPENLRLPAPRRRMRTSGNGEYRVCRLGFLERQAMPPTAGNKLTYKKVRHAYIDVFQSMHNRAGVMAFPRLIPTNSKHPSAKIMLDETAR